jgi:pimeloyl-ACP methyl ester carboxylesterase
MKQIHFDNTSFTVVDDGKGMPILFVHGFPLDHSMWQSQIDHFSKRYQVIAPDLRGFGNSKPVSSQLPRTISMKRYADDLNVMLNKLQIREPIVFCGLSMGGYIAWEFVRHYSERVSALILCDTRARADSAEIARGRRFMADGVVDAGTTVATRGMLDRMISSQTRESSPHIATGIQASIDATVPQAIAAAQRGMADRADSTDLLPLITVPTLFVCGEDDQITPVAEMELMAASVPGSRIEVIPGAGHMSPMEQPDLTNQAIDAFLQTAIAAGRR